MKHSLDYIVTTIHAMKQKLGVISTVTADAKPEAAIVYFTLDKDLNIYFATRAGSRKYKNLIKNPNAAFVIANEHPPQTVQIEGTVSIVGNADEQRDLFPELISMATESNLVPPISQMMDSEMMFMKITTNWIRFGNFDLYRIGDVFEEVSKGQD